jgi:hypothetical protein
MPPEPNPQRKSAKNQRKSVRQSASGGAKPRSGRRPGAPKGNLNALKHGRRSRQFAEIAALFAASPLMRSALLRLAAQQGIEQARADELAYNLLKNVLTRGIQLGRDRQGNPQLSALPPVVDGQTTIENIASGALPEHETPPEKNRQQPNNPPPDTNPSKQPDSRYENPPN